MRAYPTLRLFHQAASDVYIIGASCSCLQSRSWTCYPFLPPHSPQMLSNSLLFMELFHHCFLHIYYRGLLDAGGKVPMKHLNNLSPPVCICHTYKVFPTKSQNYSCYLHLQESWGGEGANVLLIFSLFGSVCLVSICTFVCLSLITCFSGWKHDCMVGLLCTTAALTSFRKGFWKTNVRQKYVSCYSIYLV